MPSIELIQHKESGMWQPHFESWIYLVRSDSGAVLVIIEGESGQRIVPAVDFLAGDYSSTAKAKVQKLLG